ncbi:hypothetical protein F511_37338 [Dorcoceras hygrometricum]|uniref:Uncharacterized protein n=1 Tax=Dorcoceras hygrometricum TaxID=472368 RepID=A0A2Z7AHI4_9LAMI|nr:hypothetical protein F511_37338 [Dorcoceras hygrometricum]
MHEIKATTKHREPKDSKAAQQMESEQKTVATMCVSIWELPTRLSTRYQVYKQRSTCCCPTHEMWELPTPLTVANSPSREMRYESYLLASTNTLERSIQQSKGTTIRDLKQHATYACMQCNTMQHTIQGRCLRTPHQLQASVQKQHPNEASQQEESSAITLTSIGAVYRRQSEKIRSRNRSHSMPKQISTKSNDVAQVHYRNWTRHPLLRSESIAQEEYETQNDVVLSILKTNAAHY